MGKERILLEDRSPVCDIQAFVEDNGDCIYFYLWVHPGSGHAEIRNCWVCNTVPGTEDMDHAAMKSGRAPRMPLPFVAHEPEGIRLDEGELSLLWFEEGDGAAPYEGERLIAVIPGWSGPDFSGYSIYAKGMGPFAWGLSDALDVLKARLDRCRTYWDVMNGDYFGEMQQEQLAAMEAFFGPYKKYYAIDREEFPPKALVTGGKDGNLYAFTLGNGALAQPKIEGYYQEEAYRYRRIEFGAAFPAGCSQEGVMAVLNYMAAQSSLPWKEISWLGHGHTIPCGAVPGYEAVLLLDPAQCRVRPGPAFSGFMGEPVNLLWMMLLTGDEYRMAKEGGGESLLERKGDAPASWNLV